MTTIPTERLEELIAIGKGHVWGCAATTGSPACPPGPCTCDKNEREERIAIAAELLAAREALADCMLLLRDRDQNLPLYKHVRALLPQPEKVTKC